MTVGELIVELQKLPMSKIVMYEHHEGESEVVRVKANETVFVYDKYFNQSKVDVVILTCYEPI